MKKIELKNNNLILLIEKLKLLIKLLIKKIK